MILGVRAMCKNEVEGDAVKFLALRSTGVKARTRLQRRHAEHCP